MTETQLVRSMAIGALRLRLNAAVRWFSFALLAVSFVAAAGVLAARLWPAWGPLLAACGWVLPVAVVVLAAFGFRWCRPATREVAMRLDRVARLQEHLTTWDENRHRALPEDPVACSFVSLQRDATLRAAQGLRPWRLLPLALPGWTRVLWLGLMALGCATLMPEQREEAGRVLGTRTDADAAVAGKGGIARRLPGSEARETFRRIEILPPSELHMLTALVSGPDVPEALREDALRDLEAKIGTLRESDLSVDVRELLSKLRRLVRGEEGAAAGNGALTANGTEPADAGSQSGTSAAANPPTPQEAVGVARARFPDVAAALQRYYMGELRESGQ